MTEIRISLYTKNPPCSQFLSEEVGFFIKERLQSFQAVARPTTPVIQNCYVGNILVDLHIRQNVLSAGNAKLIDLLCFFCRLSGFCRSLNAE